MHFLSFLFIWTVFISLFLKENFARCRILGWLWFSFSTLSISTHCLLASTVSDKKSAVNFIKAPLYMINCLSYWFQDSLSLAYNSLITVCFSMDLFEFILLGLFWVWLWICWLMFFIKFGKFPANISSNILSAHSLSVSVSLSLPLSLPPSLLHFLLPGTPVMPMLIFLMCPKGFWHSLHLLLLLEACIHSIFSANWIILIYLQVHWYCFFRHLKSAVESW